MQLSKVYALTITILIFFFLLSPIILYIRHLFRLYIRSYLKFAWIYLSIGYSQYFGIYILLQLTYIGINLFFLLFRTQSLRIASIKAAQLAVINLIPLYLSPSLTLVSYTTGVSSKTIRYIHICCSIVITGLLCFHCVATIFSGLSFPIKEACNRWGLIVC